MSSSASITMASLTSLSSSTGQEERLSSGASRSRSSSLSSLSSLASSLSSLSSLSDSEEDRPSRKRPQKRRKQEVEVEVEVYDQIIRWAKVLDDGQPGLDGKVYLVEGLYAPERDEVARKEEDEGKRPAALVATAKLGPAPSTHSFMNHKITLAATSHHLPILPLPLSFGSYLLTQERPFRLPFDIGRDLWYDGATARVGNRGEERMRPMNAAERERMERSKRPDKYRRIPRNIYVERKPDKSETPAICMCPKESGCVENVCMNRLMQYLCDAKTCPVGSQCSNLPFNEREGIPEGKDGLKVIWTGNRGFGLKTMVPIKAGDFVMQYLGEIISRDESYRRVLTVYKEAKSFYFLNYDGEEVIDAGLKGNAARYINHSCGANLIIQSWKLSQFEEYQIGIFAKEDIAADTELTYDYGWQDFSTLLPATTLPPAASNLASTSSSTLDTPLPPVLIPRVDPARQKCYCGAGACTGYLGGKRDNKKESKKSILLRKNAESNSKSSHKVRKEGKQGQSSMKTNAVKKGEKSLKPVAKKLGKLERDDERELEMENVPVKVDRGAPRVRI